MSRIFTSTRSEPGDDQPTTVPVANDSSDDTHDDVDWAADVVVAETHESGPAAEPDADIDGSDTPIVETDTVSQLESAPLRVTEPGEETSTTDADETGESSSRWRPPFGSRRTDDHEEQLADLRSRISALPAGVPADDDQLHDDQLVLDQLSGFQRTRLKNRLRRELKQRERDERWSRKYRARRHRILPRSIIGIAVNLVAFAAGTALAGVLLFAWYDSRLADTRREVDATLGGFDASFSDALAEIETLRDETNRELDNRLDAVRQQINNAAAITELPAQIGESVWFVRTQDLNGQPSTGTAFVVGSNQSSSFLLTSFSVVEAASVEPGPAIVLSDRGREIEADLYDWDPELDLAVLTIPDPALPRLQTVPVIDTQDVIGDSAFAMSGLGGLGGSVTYGRVTDQSAAGLRTDLPLGADFRGAPLLTRSGDVLGIVSLDYSPLGFDPGGVHFVIPFSQACNGVLECGSDFGDEELAAQRQAAEREEAIANGENPDAPDEGEDEGDDDAATQEGEG